MQKDYDLRLRARDDRIDELEQELKTCKEENGTRKDEIVTLRIEMRTFEDRLKTLEERSTAIKTHVEEKVADHVDNLAAEVENLKDKKGVTAVWSKAEMEAGKVSAELLEALTIERCEGHARDPVWV